MHDGPLRLVVPASLAGTRFDRALAELVPGPSGAQLRKRVRRGHVKVDGRRVVRSSFRVGGGERLVVHADAHHALHGRRRMTRIRATARARRR